MYIIVNYVYALPQNIWYLKHFHTIYEDKIVRLKSAYIKIHFTILVKASPHACRNTRALLVSYHMVDCHLKAP